jgi:hypothetical protein
MSNVVVPAGIAFGTIELQLNNESIAADAGNAAVASVSGAIQILIGA